MTQRVIKGLIAILLLTSCHHDKLDVDISGINVPPLKFLRLDEDLFKINAANFDETSNLLRSRYGNFYEHYLSSFLNRGGSKDTLYKGAILQFTSDKDVRGCYNQVSKAFQKKEIDEIVGQANDCVKRFKYHFPGHKLPSKLITCLTGWNYAAAYTDSALVVGLDMYLGDTCMYYQMLHLPQYRTRFMNKYSILPDLIRGWMISEFDNTDPSTTLLNYTIFYGKIYYSVNALLPHTHDSLLLGYTAAQLKYCNDFEKNLWGYFAEKNRLYENNMKEVQELTAEGPFTGSISKDCPPRIAMWVGLQIVRSYMKNNEVTVDELMKEKDAQKILSKSKYRP
ncbi:MAG: gliding motility lipoprotein GldB [Bacteroidia bacterium]